ncbi:serine hydrolase domain-containing protein [Flavisolibacter nicotianae]|uniref:serine hydrolase domain-containing protein n=1 Tax=Flavisolibacter nicotianae TaxID=2364882 RepID=UPI0013C3F87B|nr:serine hydrolase [Flavisolibacter nicotianae]
MPALDKVMDDKKKQLGNDFSVVIAVGDSVVYQRTTGDIANLKTPSPIGASSQWLTTALILQLADEGKLSLDDPVSKYLPIFESYRRNYITLRHCLTHQTGLGKEGSKLGGLFDKKKFASLDEEVTDILKKEIHANAGEEFRYSSYGPVVAARVAEAVTKKRFDQLIRTKLFVPLGMRNTSFTTDDGSAPDPSGGANSTATDLTKFLQMLLNNGKAGDKQVLSESALEEMRKIQVASAQIKNAPAADQGFSFALGTWTADKSAPQGGKAASLVVPGLAGTWPEVDFHRGFVFLVFTRNFPGDQTAQPFLDLKQIADQHFPVKKN